jgi:hypothetical protein
MITRVMIRVSVLRGEAHSRTGQRRDQRAAPRIRRFVSSLKERSRVKRMRGVLV